MKAKHTQGLWEASLGRVFSSRRIQIADCYTTDLSIEEDRANAARIVECVNACTGIENPGEAIRDAREALCLALEVIEATGSGSYPDAETAIGEALAKLKGAAE